MSILDRVLGTKCDVCGSRISGKPHELNGRTLCAACNEVTATRKVVVPEVEAPPAGPGEPRSE